MPKSNKSQKGLLDTWGRRNRKLPDTVCLECGKTFRPIKAGSKYCSRPCAWANNGGQNKKQETWWKNQRGYIEGRIWLHDGTQVRVRQHRFVMEGILGRPLEHWEDVHHVDGNKANNKPENLRLIAHGDHSKVTNSMRSYRKGYKLNLTEHQRRERSIRAIAQGLYKMGQAAISKATGGE